MKIEKDRIIIIDYVMTDDTGKVLEDTSETGPSGFLFGHEAMMPAIEEALSEKETGDSLDVSLSPDRAFGERLEDLVETIDRSKFSKDIAFEPGQLFQVPGPEGYPESVRVVEATEAHVKLDRNHPMAGKEVSFSITVREVREATDLEIEHGHPMDSDCGCDGQH